MLFRSHSTMGQHSPDLPNFDFDDDVFYDHVSLKPGNNMESSYLVTGRENSKQRTQKPYVPQGSAFLSVDDHSDYLPPRRTRRSEERRVGKECRSRWSPHH